MKCPEGLQRSLSSSLMKPLAERMRPKAFEHFYGQGHLLDEGKPLRLLIEADRLPSMILWGPPGVGKTSLSLFISGQLDRPCRVLSAVHAGVKDVRAAIQWAGEQRFMDRPSPILFIDEIHRFSKSQQDALLEAVEKGVITLIGATTENPSFEVIPALRSRCTLYVLKGMTPTAMTQLLERAVKDDDILAQRDIRLVDTTMLMRYSGGDARRLLNGLEAIVHATSEGPIIIDESTTKDILGDGHDHYDKGGEMHYDTISAFIKSIRGSDPDAAVYYLARMLRGGEDIKFIARRLIISASEDIGLANPNALLMAVQGMQACQMIGMPEARIILSQVTIYLACSPKSNASYTAIDAALDHVGRHGTPPVPLHLRNAPTDMMRSLGYGQDYKYAHNYADHFVKEDYFPQGLKDTSFFHPSDDGPEERYHHFMKKHWPERMAT